MLSVFDEEKTEIFIDLRDWEIPRGEIIFGLVRVVGWAHYVRFPRYFDNYKIRMDYRTKEKLMKRLNSLAALQRVWVVNLLQVIDCY